MKTLGKLNINSEKIIKNEELLTLRGGYDGGCCMCYCNGAAVGVIASTSAWDCTFACNDVCAYNGTTNYSEWQC